jgi:hypothetical protein
MSIFEHLFNSSVLDVAIPNSSLEYPPPLEPDEWLLELGAGNLERAQAFFDEQLLFYLTVRLDHPSANPVDPSHPPPELLNFLTHVQVSLEATYISPVPSPVSPHTGRLLSAPPRLSAVKPKNRLGVPHPSIFPPNTPNPTPSTTGNDSRYIQSEGTLLLASIWGQDTGENICEAFTLLWSKKEMVWVAVYRLGLTVCE